MNSNSILVYCLNEIYYTKYRITFTIIEFIYFGIKEKIIKCLYAIDIG